MDMDIKLNVRQFSGRLTMDYRVLPEVQGEDVTLKLLVSLNGRSLQLDEVTTTLPFGNERDKEFDRAQFEENLRYALHTAQERWGMELTKANLKIA